MRMVAAVLHGAAIFLASTVSVLANDAHREVPEPNALVLLAIASAGILIGRRMAYRKPPSE